MDVVITSMVVAIVSSLAGLYWGVKIGTGQVSWIKVTRRPK